MQQMVHGREVVEGAPPQAFLDVCIRVDRPATLLRRARGKPGRASHTSRRQAERSVTLGGGGHLAAHTLHERCIDLQLWGRGQTLARQSLRIEPELHEALHDWPVCVEPRVIEESGQRRATRTIDDDQLAQEGLQTCTDGANGVPPSVSSSHPGQCGRVSARAYGQGQVPNRAYWV